MPATPSRPQAAAPRADAPPHLGDRRFAGAFDAAPTGMALIDRDGRLVAANSHLARLVGVPASTLVGRTVAELTTDADRERNAADLARLFDEPGSRARMAFALPAPGGAVPVTVHASAVDVGHDGVVRDVVVYVEDLRPRIDAQARVEFLSTRDAATGLLNRRSATDRLQRLLACGAGRTAGTAALAVDVDRFQVVNDRLGHVRADEVLREVGQRIQRVLGEGDVARTGADQFLGLAGAVDGPDAAVDLAGAIRTAVAEPLTVSGHEMHLSCTVGVAVAQDDDLVADALVQRAEIALHRARVEGRAVDLADAADARAVVRQLEVEVEVARLVHAGAVDVAFQPIQSRDGTIVGVEALVRPQGTDIGPGAFIAAAERSPLIMEVGRTVLERALAAMPALDAAAGRPLILSVNLSARQLHDPATAHQVLAAAARHGHPAAQLCVEVTETAAMANLEASIATLRTLREAGVRVAVDDFGMGYSTFAYLRDMPVDEVKVDMSFLHRAAEDAGARKVMAGMISLCQGLGLETVCEGVEDERHRDLAVDAGCTRWQGYLASRPLPATELGALLARPAAEATALPALLAQLGLVDLLVFHQVDRTRYAHLGGLGRGEGWAGVVDVDLAGEAPLAAGLRAGDRVLRQGADPVHVIGPYWARTAAVVAAGDALVVLGHPTEAVALRSDDPRIDRAVRLATRTVRGVPAEKRMADEVELLDAVRTLLSGPVDQPAVALAHLLDVALSALSCELAVAHLPGVGTAGRGVDPDVVDVDGLRALVADGPAHRQRGADPGVLGRAGDVTAWLAVPLPGDGALLLAHTRRAPRGFTDLCRRIAAALADAADVLLRAAGVDVQPMLAPALAPVPPPSTAGPLDAAGWQTALQRVAADGQPVGVLVLDVAARADGGRLVEAVAAVLDRAVLDGTAATSAGPAGPPAVLARPEDHELALLLEGASRATTAALAAAVRDALRGAGLADQVAVGQAWSPAGGGVDRALARADRERSRARLRLVLDVPHEG